MIAVSYKKSLEQEGINYLPHQTLKRAKLKADKLKEEGHLSVKVVILEERVVYIPGLGDLE